MTFLRAILAALLLRRLHRAGYRVVLYDSHCSCHGGGWVVTLDGRPHYSPIGLLEALRLAEATARRHAPRYA